uniref:Uncharacterized protein n=1 Tax=Xiphophorus couchianus TaxID=32473 RepID=A0A3B5MCX1_9TELE
CSPTVPESELYRSLQAVLPRCTDHPCILCLCAGMLRWTLHKKVQNNPANSLSLLWVLIKELEKVLFSNSSVYCLQPGSAVYTNKFIYFTDFFVFKK